MSNGTSLTSSPARSSVTMVGANANLTSSSAIGLDDYPHFTSNQDRKDEALAELKLDLMVALDKEVKSLDEDSWMFDGPRSRINLISRPGGLLHKHTEISKRQNQAAP